MDNKKTARKLVRMAKLLVGMPASRHNIEEALRDDGVRVRSIVQYGANLIVELLDGTAAHHAFAVLQSEGYPVDWVSGNHAQISVMAR